MPEFRTLRDKGHIGGQDTVLDAESDVYPLTHAVLMENLFPGEPPKPRNAVQDMMVDLTHYGYAAGGLPTLFKPPVVAMTNPVGELFFFVCHNVESPTAGYGLECWDVTRGTRYVVMSGDFTSSISAWTYFGILRQYGAILLVSDGTMTTNVYESPVTSRLKHKIIEWDAAAERWVPREMYTDQYENLTAALLTENEDSGLGLGLYYSYAATFVRRTDSDSVDGSGDPKEQTIYHPGDLEGFELPVNRHVFKMGAGVKNTTTLGNNTTHIKLSILHRAVEAQGGLPGIPSVDQWVLEYIGSGADPGLVANLPAGTYFELRDDVDESNRGTFMSIGSLAANKITFLRRMGDGKEEADVTMANTGLNIPKLFGSSRLTFTEDADTTRAIYDGMTHRRTYRTHGAETEVIAKGLTHNYLVDIPITGPNSATTWDDATSDSTLAARDAFLAMTNYTSPPQGRFINYAGRRVWIGGVIGHRGRWYCSEDPTKDVNTPFAAEFPLKYTAMFNQLMMWVDCDPDDGLIDTGSAVVGDDIYFFKERKVFKLNGADYTRKPQRLATDDIGCAFPNTIVNLTLQGYGNVVFFLSQKGPAWIRPGGVVEVVPEYAIKELWPGGELINQTYGELMNEYTREKVYAAYHHNTIFILYGDSEDTSSENLLRDNKIFGYYRSNDQQFRGCLQVKFNDFTAVGITNISPATDVAAGGATITITGIGFLGDQGIGTVKFGTTAAASYTSWTDTEIVVVAPAHAAEVVDLVMTNRDGAVGAKMDAFEFTA